MNLSANVARKTEKIIKIEAKNCRRLNPRYRGLVREDFEQEVTDLLNGFVSETYDCINSFDADSVENLLRELKDRIRVFILNLQSIDLWPCERNSFIALAFVCSRLLKVIIKDNFRIKFNRAPYHLFYQMDNAMRSIFEKQFDKYTDMEEYNKLYN